MTHPADLVTEVEDAIEYEFNHRSDWKVAAAIAAIDTHNAWLARQPVAGDDLEEEIAHILQQHYERRHGVVGQIVVGPSDYTKRVASELALLFQALAARPVVPEVPEVPAWVQAGNWETDANETSVWLSGDYVINEGFARLAEGTGATLADAISAAVSGGSEEQ